MAGVLMHSASSLPHAVAHLNPRLGWSEFVLPRLDENGTA